MELYFMDTRAFSMARLLRISASACALAIISFSGPAIALDTEQPDFVIPFASLSPAAQQEIILLQRDLALQEAAPVIATPNSRGIATQSAANPVFVDDRKIRANWAVGMYR
jgi:hypothetical protein